MCHRRPHEIVRTCCFPVMTGQETPNTDTPLHEDLYKKVISGDLVATRLPCAFLTKMVTLLSGHASGWVATMKFHGITEATFALIMLRSLVILCKERFTSAAHFARLSSGAQGCFLMQKDLEDFDQSPLRVLVCDSHG